MRTRLHITPSGHIRAGHEDSGGDWELSDSHAKDLREAFDAGNGPGLLFLSRLGSAAGIPVSVLFFRSFAREFMTRLCRAAGATPDDFPAAVRAARPDDGLLMETALAAPPVLGAEYLSPETLADCWTGMEETVLAKMKAFSGPPAAFLKTLNPSWAQIGRVSFHLAENKQDREGRTPFAFIATFIHRLSENDAPKHLPLGSAMKMYAADKTALLALLKPVMAAAGKSKFITELTESKKIFRPLAWSPSEARSFLKDIPVFEESGIIVRITNLWKNSAPPKIHLSINLDVKKGQRLDARALLDFSISSCVDGEPLTDAELETILNSEGGLTRIRGQWVEADPEKISALLKSWREAGQAAAEGIPFLTGLRMLAGAGLPSDKNIPAANDAGLAKVSASGGLKEIIAALENPSSMRTPELPGNLKATLRPYQLDGVKWLWRSAELGLGGCLADDMGLGKTLQILALLALLKERGGAKLPALIVAPASLLANWRAEAAKFTPQLRVSVAHPMFLDAGGMQKLESAPEDFLSGFDAVVTTYGMITRLEALRGLAWPALIIDEAQAIKNPNSQQSRAVRALKAERRFAMTGTPVENRITDLWSIFDCVSPGLLGGLSEFKNFVKSLDSGDGGAGFAPLRRLTKPYILRRLKTDKKIISDLPDKTEMTVYCSLTKSQAALYQRAAADMAEEIEEPDPMKRRGLIFKYLMMFKQICNHPAQHRGDGDYTPELGGKFIRVSEICAEIASRQDKALIFTQFKEITAPLHDCLAGVFGRPGLTLHGETPVKQRQTLVNQFQDEEGPPYFVLSLKAAGTGLNLTAANHVVHFDRWWNPAVENQATDRAFRIGQRRNVLVHKFVCKGTVEEKINALIEEKKSLSDALLSEGAEKLLTEMDNDELMKFVALDLNSVLSQQEQ